MGKYVIYTSLTGGYDALPIYDVIDSRFDYICFSNDYHDGSIIGHWKIRNIPNIAKDNVTLSRYPKLQPHKLLKEYEYSLWMDSNIIIKKNTIYDIVIERITEGNSWYGLPHPLRDCIYEDAKACLVGGIAKYKDICKVIKFLKEENYPANYGLFENNVILRQHNLHKIVEIDDYWWKFFISYIKRDQLSLFYIFWKFNFVPCILQNKSSREDVALEYHLHKRSYKLRIKRKLNKIINYILKYKINKILYFN